MSLCCLLYQQRLHIDAIGVFLDLQVKHLMAVVNVLEREWIFEHPARRELDEEMTSHVVG